MRDTVLAKLIRKNSALALFPEQAPEKSPNRKFCGVEAIPIQQIIGTISRSKDFDHKFRPLKYYLRDRWINTYLSLEREGWSPILVHKVGEHYYVENGHHRVSVAKLLGMHFIEAKIWEYPIFAKKVVFYDDNKNSTMDAGEVDAPLGVAVLQGVSCTPSDTLTYVETDVNRETAFTEL